MKRMILFLGMLVLSLVRVACGGNDDADNQSDNMGEDNTAEESEQEADDSAVEDDTESDSDTADSDDMNEKMDELDYVDFELEVDYGQDKEYEAEIEQKNGNVKADLEDEINGEDLNGQEAFDKVYPLVEQLTRSEERRVGKERSARRWAGS